MKATRMVKAYDLSGWPVPTLLQEVTVSRDGTPIWKGWITKTRVRVGDGMRPKLEIEASGVWWWMKKMPLASTRTMPGYKAAADRPQFGIDGNLGDGITSLLTAYNARYGSGDARRVQVGTMAATYNMPPTRISGGDFLSALAEMLRLCPDSMAWWDTPASGHQAIFRLARRGTASVASLDVAVDHVASADFEPKPDLQLTQGVRIDFARVINDQTADTGKPEYLAQTSAGFTSEAQRIVVSGPESDTFLPATTTESAVISSATVDKFYLQAKDSGLAAITGMAAYTSLSMSGLSIRDPKTGADVTASHPYALSSSASPADWWGKLPTPITWREADITATMGLFNGWAFNWSASGAGAYNLNLTQRAGYPWGSYQKITGYNASNYAVLTTYAFSQTSWEFLQIATISGRSENVAPFANTTQNHDRWWAIYQARISATMINLPLSSATRYRPPDYTFFTPPATLAQDLADAQNWLPWEGSVDLVNPNIGDRAFAGKVLRIAGGPPDWAAMDALVQAHTMDFFSLRESVSCGIPPRLSSLNLTQKIKPNGQTNITYL